MRQYGIWVMLGAVVACSKSEAPPTASSAAAPAASAPTVAATDVAASAAPAASASVAPTPPPPPAGAPASFKGGTKENIAGAIGLGCEATSSEGWLELLCRKKNGTGGRPVKAVVTTPGAEPSEPRPSGDEEETEATAGELTPNEHGELTIVVPYHGEEKRDVVIEWSDTRYTLHVTGSKATLEWAASGVPHRRACQQLLDESKAVLTAAQRAEGSERLTTTEASKLPRFGVCQPAGLGSWALSLKAAQGKGEGAARELHLELEVVRVDIDGNRKQSPFGALDVTPGGLKLAGLQVYDYDDDGNNELIVPYEVEGTLSPRQQLPLPVWSFNDSGVVAYTKAPAVGGGIGVEQLDFDMRPDLGTYGAFVAYLGPDCGLKTCPPRIVGPKLYHHSLPDGSFSAHDDAVRAALKRACPSKSVAVVAGAPGAVNAAQTAKNLVCAKAWGAPLDALQAELTEKQAWLCGEAESCPLKSALTSWLEHPLPFELPVATAK